jgi:uncharacterized protein YprB with RNaseH-like and TPR domain
MHVQNHERNIKLKKFDIKTLRCIHRQDIRHHPNCFNKGLVKYPKEEKETWYEHFESKIGYLDIETDNLKADFSTMLTWCIKERDGRITYDVVTKKELFDGLGDERIVKSCVDELSKYDIICTYFGKVFDIPFLRTKSLHYNLPFPGFTTEFSVSKTGRDVVRTSPDIYHFDIYFLAKSKLCLSRKSLESVCDYLNIKGKTPIDREIWRRGKYGDPDALRDILSHNKGDVEILERLHKKLEDHSKWIKSPL